MQYNPITAIRRVNPPVRMAWFLNNGQAATSCISVPPKHRACLGFLGISTSKAWCRHVLCFHLTLGVSVLSGHQRPAVGLA